MQDSGRKSNVLDRFSDPQSDPQNALFCVIASRIEIRDDAGGGLWPSFFSGF